MRIRILTLILGLLVIGVSNACAQNRFEWVKVNPETIHLSKPPEAQSNSVRYVNLFIQLKEKDRVISYPESDGFFAAQKEVIGNKIVVPSHGSRGHFKTADQKVITKKPILNDSKTPTIVAQPTLATNANFTEASKLNDALKIPANSKVLKSTAKEGSFGPSAAEVRELAFKNIKEKNPELEKRFQEKEKKGKNLIWAGLVLLVIGGIMGFIVGKSAFLISLAGIVFVVIGYFVKI